jgi:hypothetical protein
MIKYKYANNKDGKLIDIDSVDKNKKESYFCINCENELIPKIGRIRSRHFAHKNIEIVCSFESYLHVLGKKTFYNIYKTCVENKDPFYIEIEQKKICDCYKQQLNKTCKLNKIEKIDITKYFNKIFFEKKIDEFIPDLYLLNEEKNEMVFIEIAVTHKLTDKKESSKYRIIEIQMETEEDLQIITGKVFSQQNDKIKFINFKNKFSGNFCKGNCEKLFFYLTLDKRGRALLKTKTLKEILSLVSRYKSYMQIYSIKDFEDTGFMHVGEIFKKFVAKCAIENLNIRNCFICRYHALNEYYDSELPIFCKFLKETFNSNKAVECDYFRKENKYVKEIINDAAEKPHVYTDIR